MSSSTIPLSCELNIVCAPTSRRDCPTPRRSWLNCTGREKKCLSLRARSDVYVVFEWLVVSRAKQRERQEVIALLAARFPQCFSIQVPRMPLKIGIHAEMLVALNGAIKFDQLQRALAEYTSVPGYLRSIVLGARRCDLYGGSAGVVTHEEAAYAKAA